MQDRVAVNKSVLHVEFVGCNTWKRLLISERHSIFSQASSGTPAASMLGPDGWVTVMLLAGQVQQRSETTGGAWMVADGRFPTVSATTKGLYLRISYSLVRRSTLYSGVSNPGVIFTFSTCPIMSARASTYVASLESHKTAVGTDEATGKESRDMNNIGGGVTQQRTEKKVLWLALSHSSTCDSTCFFSMSIV